MAKATYKRKHFIGECLTVLEGYSMIIIEGCLAADTGHSICSGSWGLTSHPQVGGRKTERV